ncbi:hypothetical protein HMPREF3189_01552 [Clostridiales bacterium KA00134]|nr:hypothetical protein HMPREF3189_01552 [Clostridiales bacterium KA00134]
MFNSTSWLFVLRGCSLKKQLTEIDRSHEQLYEDRLEGNITERNFNLMNVSISEKQDKNHSYRNG